MSLWSDMRSRSNGENIKKEDEAIIYGGDAVELREGTYKDMKYTIGTTGSYPYVFIESKLDISVFSGASIIVLEDIDGESYKLERFTENNLVTFNYGFNKKDDYISGVYEDGKKYTVDYIETLVKKFIDHIDKAERDFIVNRKD